MRGVIFSFWPQRAIESNPNYSIYHLMQNSVFTIAWGRNAAIISTLFIVWSVLSAFHSVKSVERGQNVPLSPWFWKEHFCPPWTDVQVALTSITRVFLQLSSVNSDASLILPLMNAEANVPIPTIITLHFARLNSTHLAERSCSAPARWPARAGCHVESATNNIRRPYDCHHGSDEPVTFADPIVPCGIFIPCRRHLAGL